MNPQEIFETVKNHLLTQGKKAKAASTFNTCKYRTQDGLKCAVGCLIPDDKYMPEFDGSASIGIYTTDLNTFVEINNGTKQCSNPEIAKSFISAIEDTVGELTPAKLSLLGQLQNIHDNRNVEEWNQALFGVEEDVRGGIYG